MEAFRLKSPPMIFWNSITPSQWEQLTDEEQDSLVDAAKIILQKGNYPNVLAYPNQDPIGNQSFQYIKS